MINDDDDDDDDDDDADDADETTPSEHHNTTIQHQHYITKIELKVHNHHHKDHQKSQEFPP